MPDDKRPFRSLPLVQREVALLIVLSVIATLTFGVTRRLASWSRERRAELAAQWFALGGQLTTAGDVDAGTAALREAVAADRQSPRFVLALARALAEAGHHSEARQLLVQLRQAQPDDMEVNYRLARLDAAAGDVGEARRYYSLAMYGLVRIGEDLDRRQIRTELIRFLLDENDRQEALTELIALGRELPDEPKPHVLAAHFADRAGDERLAFQHYTRAAQLDPSDPDAAAGAGEAALALGDFATAARELGRAVALGRATPDVKSRLDTARLVAIADPLGRRLATPERARRVLAGLSRATDRDGACAAASDGPAKAPDVERAEIDTLRRGRMSELRDADVLVRAVELIGNLEGRVAARCPAVMEPIDRAWILIAGFHRSGGS